MSTTSVVACKYLARSGAAALKARSCVDPAAPDDMSLIVLPANGLLGIFGGLEPDDAAEVDEEAAVVAVLEAELLEPQAARIVALATAAPTAKRTPIYYPQVFMVRYSREPSHTSNDERSL